MQHDIPAAMPAIGALDDRVIAVLVLAQREAVQAELGRYRRACNFVAICRSVRASATVASHRVAVVDFF